MLSSNQIKEKLINDNGLLIKILEDYGFCDVWIDNKLEYLRCAYTEGENNTSVCVNLSNLYSTIFSKNVKGDIYSILQWKTGENFKQVHRKLNGYFGEDDININIVKKQLFGGVFKKYVGLKQNDKVYDEKVLKAYGTKPNERFLEDGISIETQIKFGIGYDFQNHRITIPWKNIEGDLIGISSRNNDDLSNAPKYLATLPFTKSNNLYGYYENYETIVSKRKVIIVESEKSVLQAYTFGIFNLVAVGCHSLSDNQMDLLKYNVDTITIMYDKDVDEDEVIKQCQRLKAKLDDKKIYYCIDNKGLLGEKGSPTDYGKEVFLEICKQIKEFGDENE